MPRSVRHDYHVVLHEICGQRSPRIAVFRVPMDEDHHGTASSPTPKNVCPFRAVDGLCLKAGRQGGLSLGQNCREKKSARVRKRRIIDISVSVFVNNRFIWGERMASAWQYGM